jgi:hypothetical protein
MNVIEMNRIYYYWPAQDECHRNYSYWPAKGECHRNESDFTIGARPKANVIEITIIDRPKVNVIEMNRKSECNRVFIRQEVRDDLQILHSPQVGQHQVPYRPLPRG